MTELRNQIQTAQIILPCENLGEMLAFLVDRLGFRLEMIFPADEPRTAVVTGHGISLRLETAALKAPLQLRLQGAFPEQMIEGPSGLRVMLVDSRAPIALPDAPQPGLLIQRQGECDAWIEGRAGMQYRDLIPGRLGGRFIASQIRIPQGGEVPDYVHYHRVRFQMIYCRKGCVRVVYEDQGPPFVLHAGDCVLQPPEIRHRVLEASAGLEVIEIASPAVHETYVDHALSLPTGVMRPERDFSGQRFVRHIAAESTWRPWTMENCEARDTGIAAATQGFASVQAIRAFGRTTLSHRNELFFLYVLRGELMLDEMQWLREDDCCVLPAGKEFTTRAEKGVEMLVVEIGVKQ